MRYGIAESVWILEFLVFFMLHIVLPFINYRPSHALVRMWLGIYTTMRTQFSGNAELVACFLSSGDT